MRVPKAGILLRGRKIRWMRTVYEGPLPRAFVAVFGQKRISETSSPKTISRKIGASPARRFPSLRATRQFGIVQSVLFIKSHHRQRNEEPPVMKKCSIRSRRSASGRRSLFVQAVLTSFPKSGLIVLIVLLSDSEKPRKAIPPQIRRPTRN